VLDRYSQLAPKVMICVDGYQYGGKPFDRRDEMAHIANNLPTLQKVVLLPYLDRNNRAPLVEGGLLWDDLLATADPGEAAFVFQQVPAQSPLWILFSSGTTGLPKPIVHTHVGITLEQQKLVQLHMDVKEGERLFFYTTTGWMMWNFLVTSLLSGVVPVLYDGNPAFPGPDQLWKVVQDFKIDFFGASPTYQQILEKQGIVPKDRFDLSRLKTVMLAGSPVTPECMVWFYTNVKADLWVQSGSGGTDICSGFCGGVPTQPVYAGEIQAPHLGVNLLAFDADGKPVVDEVGEMVITEPMPSMPLGFWNDAGHVRYTESYFSDYPGIWRQGDFFRLNARRGCFVLGRSDATLNRHGIRIGTAEIYRSLALLPEVEDSLVVNLDLPGGHFFMPLFVKVRAGSVLDKGLEDRIKAVLRTEYSPRHVPDRIFPVPAIPYTITGKKLEVPVRRILAGYAVEKAVNRSAMADATAIDWYIDYAANQTDYQM
jgi:acetoacetyl-CoA synthetase